MGLITRAKMWAAGQIAAMDGGTELSVAEWRERITQGGLGSNSKKAVTPLTAMQQVAVYRSVSLISGAGANTPLLVTRVDKQGRHEEVHSGEVVNLLTWKPNKWQTGRQFRRYLITSMMLTGNGYARKVYGANGKVIAYIPMSPTSVTPEQDRSTLEITYKYAAPSGREITFQARDVMHVYLTTLDGFRGISPIGFQRELISEAMAVQEHGAHTYRNGARVGGLLTTEKALGTEGRQRLRTAMEQYRAGGEREGSVLVLEDGVTFNQVALSHKDAEYIASRKMTRAEIYIIYGVPAHLAADAENRGSGWGTGMEEQRGNFVGFVLEDYYTAIEDAINRDFVLSGSDVRVTHDRRKIMRGDFKSRVDAGARAIETGMISFNEWRRWEALNDREGGDEYMTPMNMRTGQEEGEQAEPAPATDEDTE